MTAVVTMTLFANHGLKPGDVIFTAPFDGFVTKPSWYITLLMRCGMVQPPKEWEGKRYRVTKEVSSTVIELEPAVYKPDLFVPLCIAVAVYCLVFGFLLGRYVVAPMILGR